MCNYYTTREKEFLNEFEIEYKAKLKLKNLIF
jgi:hypothetical protein